jgi:glycosyltransferase involved in cell wall biosynthesis
VRIAYITIANNLFVRERSRWLVQNGHDVHYIGVMPHDPSLVNAKFVVPEGVTYHVINSKRKGRLARTLAKARGLIRIVRSLSPDVLHIIDMGYTVYLPFLPRKKVVLEHNGTDILVKPLKSVAWRLFYRFVYRYADAVIQDSVVAQEAGFACGAPRHNNEVIELGIDFSVFSPNIRKGTARERLGFAPDDRFVFSPRGFKALYNIETILRSIPMVAASVPRVRYVFCSPVLPSNDSYRMLIDELGIAGYVTFAGLLDKQNELPFFYADAEVVLSVPSSDSSPSTVYEALACETSVIVSELPWYHGRFEAGRDFQVVPVGDAEALAAAVVRQLEGRIRFDPAAIRERVRRYSDIDVNGRKLEQLYSRL